MTVAEALRDAEKALAAAAVPNARLDAEVLLALVIGTRRDLLPARLRDTVSTAAAEHYRDLLARRAEARIPLQYLTGMQEFYSLEFHVTPSVLIPRPETELLVDEMIAFARERSASDADRPLRAMDVGTGSGCIAVASAVHIPALRILALDLSLEAARLAAENARRHGVLHGGGSARRAATSFSDSDRTASPGGVEIVVGDLLAAVRPGSLDAVLSNPPYVARNELDGLQAEVRAHEPGIALVSGETGLEIYERLIPQAEHALRPGGLLALELAASRHDPVRALVERGPWERIAFRDDFQGFPRVITARRR